MDEEHDYELDAVTEAAWDHFEDRLAGALMLLEDGDVVVIEVETGDAEGRGGYVQFLNDDAALWMEVSSNEYLPDGLRLDAAAEQVLRALGLSIPAAAGDATGTRGPANWRLHAPMSDGEAVRQAELAVRALREVLGAFHPAFVHSDQLQDDEPDGDDLMAAMPTGREHLLDLVDDALTPLFSSPPRHDDDDDIPVVHGGSVAYVRVHAHAPIVEMFATVVEDVTNPDAATFEVNVLNRDSTFVRYSLVGQTVLARLCLPAHPFVPQHLRDMLAVFGQAIDAAAPDLAHRVGGARPPVSDDPPF